MAFSADAGSASAEPEVLGSVFPPAPPAEGEPEAGGVRSWGGALRGRLRSLSSSSGTSTPARPSAADSLVALRPPRRGWGEDDALRSHMSFTPIRTGSREASEDPGITTESADALDTSHARGGEEARKSSWVQVGGAELAQ